MLGLGLCLPNCPLGSGAANWAPGATLALDFTRNSYIEAGLAYGNPSAIPGWSFSRASTGTALTSSGTIVSFGSGVPRITGLGLLIEQAATNLQTYSVPTTVQWNSSMSGTGINPVITPSFALAPDGTISAVRVQLDKGSGSTASDFAQFFGPATSALTGTYTGSIWVRTNDGSTKTVSLRDGTGVTSITVTAAWARFTIVSTPSASTENVGVRLRGGVENTAQTADLLLWGGQVEQGSAASSYIPTTSAAVTRAADVASIGGLSIAAPLTLSAQGLPTWTTTGISPRLATLIDASSHTVDLLVDAAVSTPAVSGSGLTVTDIGSPMSSGGLTKMAATLSGVGAVRSAANGSGAAAVTGTATLGTTTTLRLGDTATSNRPLSGYLQRVVVYPTAYTGAQLQALTQ